MADIIYRIVEHDGGFAYKLGDVFSETFPTHDDAFRAATVVAAEQQSPGDAEIIRYQDETGGWRQENEAGDDRPTAKVVD